MKRPIVLILMLVLAAAACEREAAEQPPPVLEESPTGEQALGETSRCSNPEIGYSVAYPAEWQTNPGDVMPECSLFDPAPIEVTPGTEIPFDIAVVIRRESVPFATIAGEQRGQREMLREETTVAGRPAVRLETENTEALLRPEGARSYRYLLDLGGETLVAATHDAGELPYERKKQILDEMIATLQLTSQP